MSSRTLHPSGLAHSLARIPRLDLELDRVRSLLVLAQVQKAMGRPQAARDHVQDFLARWSQADPELPELVEARRLLDGE